MWGCPPPSAGAPSPPLSALLDYKSLPKFEMFYRIRQSFSTNFKKKNLQVFFFFLWFFLSSHPPPYFFCVCFSFPPPPSPSPPALFPLVVFWTPPRVRGADGWGFTGTLGSRSSSCSIGLCPGSSSATKNKKKNTNKKPPHLLVKSVSRGTQTSALLQLAHN